MRLLYEFIGVVVWVLTNPDRAVGLWLHHHCKPLWRWVFKRRIEARAQQENADRMLLSSFRQKLAESDLPYRLHIVGTTKAKLIRKSDEVEIAELKIISENNNLWILLPREIK